MEMSETAVAHRAWDKRWATPEGRADWLAPEPFILDRLERLGGPGDTALDLGCGVGRHAIALARAGFRVDALDGSPAGLDHGASTAREAGLTIGWHLGGMLALPFPDQSYEVVISWNVIYHGTGDEMRQTMVEIARVLKPGGRVLLTLLSTRDRRFGLGREISPSTYVIDGEEEKGHPHYYVDALGAAGLFRGFNLLDLEHREHRKPGSWHWHAFAVKD